MKLQSTTDFALHLHSMTTGELCKEYPKRFKMPSGKTKNELVIDFLAIDAIKWDIVKEHAKFLKQPLELWMFVPCDRDRNILEEPKGFDNFRFTDKLLQPTEENNAWFRNCVLYEEAKNRVLFEGWKYADEFQIEKDNVIISFGSWQFIIEGSLGLSGGNIYPENLEGLSRTELALPLTETAIKQLGL